VAFFTKDLILDSFFMKSPFPNIFIYNMIGSIAYGFSAIESSKYAKVFSISPFDKFCNA